MRAGTSDYDRLTQRRLSIVNLSCYLSALSSITFAANFAMHDFATLKWLIIGNLISALITGTAFYWHRFGSMAAVSLLGVTVATSIFYFISVLGRDSGIQLNYLGGVALAFIAFGLENMRAILFATISATILHILAYLLFDTGSLTHAIDPAFMNQLYVTSAVSITLIIALVVLYTMRVAADAEARSETLLLNIFPDSIAHQLRRYPNKMIAERFDEATALFADIVGFTPLSQSISPEELISLLNDIFSRFDELGQQYGTEKVKTIGDAYMAVCGVPVRNERHRRQMALVALGMLKAIKEISLRRNIALDLRIGMASGPLTAGVIGKTRFAYDVWAPVVNLASRLESNGEAGKIMVSHEIYSELKGEFKFEKSPNRDLKGIGSTKVWFLTGKKQVSS